MTRPADRSFASGRLELDGRAEEVLPTERIVGREDVAAPRVGDLRRENRRIPVQEVVDAEPHRDVLGCVPDGGQERLSAARRSEENTSEPQSRMYIVCRLRPEKKKKASES